MHTDWSGGRRLADQDDRGDANRLVDGGRHQVVDSGCMDALAEDLAEGYRYVSLKSRVVLFITLNAISFVLQSSDFLDSCLKRAAHV